MKFSVFIRKLSPLLFLFAVVIFLTACSLNRTPDKAVSAQPLPPVSPCDSLTVGSLKTDCQAEVDNTVQNYLYREATAIFDLSHCSILTSLESVKSCEKKIAEAGVQGPVTSADFALFAQAQSERLSDKCNAIQNPSYKNYCIQMVQKIALEQQVMDIIASGKSSRCSEIQDPAYAGRCLDSFDPKHKKAGVSR